MAVDRRRGLKRLAIAVAVPWFAWWGLYGWSGYNAYNYGEAQWWKSEKAGDLLMMGVYAKMQSQGSAQIGAAVLWGVAVPILLLIVGALAYWVYRGFKPRD